MAGGWCWAETLGDCKQGKSGEHLVSESIFVGPAITEGTPAGTVARGVPSRITHRHVDDTLVDRRTVPGLDARTVPDPLVGGVDGLADLGVADHPRGAIAADAEDAGVLGTALGLQDRHRQCTASGWSRMIG